MMKKTALTTLMFAACLGLGQVGYSKDAKVVDKSNKTSAGLTDDQAIILMGSVSSVAIRTQNQSSGQGIIDDVVIDLMRYHHTDRAQSQGKYAGLDNIQTDTEIILGYQKANPYTVQKTNRGKTTGITDDQAIELSKVHYGIDPNSPMSYLAISIGNDQSIICSIDQMINCTCQDS
jgi:hypothetical protein